MPRLRSLLVLVFVASLADAADWPQWLGPRRDGASAEKVAPWKEEPKAAWRADVGAGFSVPVVAAGRLHPVGRAQEQLDDLSQREAVVRQDGQSRQGVHRLVEVHPVEARETPAAPVAVTSFFDSAVYAFDSATGAMDSTLVAPYNSSLLSGPAGITLGPDNNLYISSQFNNSILEYNLPTHTLSTFIPSSMLQPIAAANGLSQFAPAGLRFGPDGNLYVSLNGGQNASSGGAVIRFLVDIGPLGLKYDGTSATVATGLVQPTGLTFGSGGDAGSLYVSNVGGDDVVKVTGATTASPNSAPLVAAGSGGLNYPSGLSWGPDGVYDITVNHTAVTGSSGQALAADQTDTFYRLFGDSNGDGRINATDAAAFNLDFGVRYSGFTPTI